MKDIWITESGELEVGPDGDFRVAEDSEAIAQAAMFRGKTVIGDFPLQPLCGASLESLIGEPNTQETGNLMYSLLMSSLTWDGLLSQNQISIDVFPISTTTLMGVVTIYTEGDPAEYSVEVDLKEGSVTQTRIS